MSENIFTRPDEHGHGGSSEVDEAGGTPDPTENARSHRVQGSAGSERPLSARAWHSLRSGATFAIFVAIFIVYAITQGSRFSSPVARLLDVHQNVPTLLLGLAVTVCLVSGQFDLSVAGVTTLTAYLAIGLYLNQGLPMYVVIILCLVIGIACGCLNAVLVLRLRVNPFIATLATGGIFDGVATVYSKDASLSPAAGQSVPGWFSAMGSYQEKAPTWLTLVVVGLFVFLAWRAASDAWPGTVMWRYGRLVAAEVVVILVFAFAFKSIVSAVSDMVVLLLLVSCVLWVVMRYTTVGRHLYAAGGNPAAALLAGVHVNRIQAGSFVLSGCLAALAGVALATIQGSASPEVANGYLLPAYAAGFLSTVLLSNGRFHIFGALLGGVFLIWISQGLISAGVAYTWTEIINGVVLAAAVAISMMLRRGDRG
jgi:ribose/xylose/arabinose/galactoside ABC-type transport system permease subunit